MPAILDDGEAKRWLTPGAITAEQVAELTMPHAADDMEAIPISTLVNRPENDMPGGVRASRLRAATRSAEQLQGEQFGPDSPAKRIRPSSLSCFLQNAQVSGPTAADEIRNSHHRKPLLIIDHLPGICPSVA